MDGNGVKTELLEGKNFFSNIGTFDGTGPEQTPVGEESGEIYFDIDIPEDGTYTISVEHINGAQSGIGSWLQVAAQYQDETLYLFDDFFGKQPEITEENKDPKNPPAHTEILTTDIEAQLKKGKCRIRLMNHRRQENTLNSYARLLEGLRLLENPQRHHLQSRQRRRSRRRYLDRRLHHQRGYSVQQGCYHGRIRRP